MVAIGRWFARDLFLHFQGRPTSRRLPSPDALGPVHHSPEEVTDGDAAYWTRGIHALLGDREEALAWLRRAEEVGNHNYPWFQRDKNRAFKIFPSTLSRAPLEA
jgi:hypothetical protein